MVPGRKRKRVNRSNCKPGIAAARRSRERWVKAIGAGTLVLSPLSLTAGVVAAWPGPAHPHPAPVGFGRPDPQYEFGFLDAYTGTGVTGAKPKNSRPSAGVLRDASKLADHASQPALPQGKLGIPGNVLPAYIRGQNIMRNQQPGCHLPWWLLAGIGKVESDHADNGLVDSQGNTLVPILGPALNGTGGNAAIPGPGGWERAVGPMQFLPSTWQVWGGGGNPSNVYDAALAAGRYLCAGGRDLSDPAEMVNAVFSYNPSDSYVQLVLAWAYGYASGVVPVPSAGLPGAAGGGSHAGGSGSGRSHGGGSAAGGSGRGGSGSGGSGSGGSGSGGSGSGGTGSGGSPSPSPTPTSPAPSPTSPSPSPSPTTSPTAAPTTAAPSPTA